MNCPHRPSTVGYSSKFEGMAITSEQMDRILRAFYTGWEARYGFYLDDGWIYTYRSHMLIARFRIKQSGASFSLSNIQRSQEKPDCADTAIESAIYSLSE